MPMPSRRIQTVSKPSAASALFAAAGLTLLLYHLPYGADVVALPLLWLSTFAHEMGHGLAALVVGGRFESLRLWWDGSGVAHTAIVPGALRSAAVSAGGLLGPALLAAALFAIGRKPRGARILLGLLGTAMLVSAGLFVRNLFGFGFCVALGAALVYLARAASDRQAQVSLLFLAVQMALSVFSRGDYLVTAVAETAGGTMPSDVAQMAAALGGPYWLWGAVVAAVSALVLLAGLGLLLRAERRDRVGD
jgi:hypothetical protein